MGQFRTIKKQAGAQLKRKRMQGALIMLAVLLPGAVTGALEVALRAFGGVPAFFEPPFPLFSLRNAGVHSVLISLLTLLLGFLVTAVVRQGARRWLWLIQQDGHAGFSELFYFFEKPDRCVKAILLRAILLLRMVGYGLLVALPSAGVLWMLYRVYTPSMREEQLGRAEPFLWMVLFLWGILALFLLALAALQYLPASYLLARAPTPTLRKVLRQSRRLMAGEKGNSLLLLLSLGVWFVPLLLAVAAVVVSLFWNFNFYGIGLLETAGVFIVIQLGILLYQVPYFSGCCAVFVQRLEDPAVDCKTREYLYHGQLDAFFAHSAAAQIDLTDAPLREEPEGENGCKSWPAADGGLA